MSFRETVCVATSIAPGNLELQKVAVRSWQSLGADVVSVNTAPEMELLAPHFSLVRFVEARRDASAVAGKPFVYLDDILAVLEREGAEICGIVNADIFLSGDGDLWKFIVEKSKKAFLFGSRIDVDSLWCLDGVAYFGGFDYFFFDREVIKIYEKTDFCLGLPWWDYWLPLVPLLKGAPVGRLTTPFAYHVKHRLKWRRQFFERFGGSVAVYLKEREGTHNLDARLKACLQDFHRRDMVGFGEGILHYLKNVPQQIYYEKSLSSQGAHREGMGSNSAVGRGGATADRPPTPAGKPLAFPREKKLKIALFTCASAPLTESGHERRAYRTARALIARGHDARVYVAPACLDEPTLHFVHPMPGVPLGRRYARHREKLAALSLPFRQWLRSAPLWHFHDFPGHGEFVTLSGPAGRTKHLIVSPPEGDFLSGDGPLPADQAARFHVLFHSQAQAGRGEKFFAHCSSVKVIPEGIDIDCFRPLPRGECLRRLGVAIPSRFVSGILHSRRDFRKDAAPLVHALGDLAGRCPGGITLLVTENSASAVRDMAAPDLSVTTLPRLRNCRELADALNLCDVLLLPSPTEDAFLTCIAALACGVPVISSDGEDGREAIQNGYNGFVVNMHDKEAVMGCLKDLVSDSALRERLSAAARTAAERYFDFDRYVDDLVAYYTEIASASSF